MLTACLMIGVKYFCDYIGFIEFLMHSRYVVVLGSHPPVHKELQLQNVLC